MGKRKAKQKNFDKDSTFKDRSKSPKIIESNALQPARDANEELPVFLPLPTIKQENIGNEEPKYMDCIEQDSSENNQDLHSVVESRKKVSVKQEPTEIEFTDIERRSFVSSIVNINNRLLKEPLIISKGSQDVIHENEANTTFSIKNEPLDGHESTSKMQDSTGEIEISNRKRKSDFKEQLEILRKRSNNIKVELPDGSQNWTNDNQSVLVHENKVLENSHTKQKQVDNIEGMQDMKKINHLDNDITILPVLKEEKDVPLIIISDEEDRCNSRSETQTSTSVTEKINQDFSTGILRYFNIASKLDRYDCQALLESLPKHKEKNNLEFFFPIVKIESKPKLEIKKGDILFKTDENIQLSAESVSQNSHFHNASTSFEVNAPPSLQAAISPSTSNSGIKDVLCPSTIELEKTVATLSRILPSSTETNNVSNYCQRLPLRDPRCRNRLPTVLKGNSIQVVAPQVPTQPAIQFPSHNFQNYSASPGTSTFESQSAVMNQGPCHAFRYTFPPRRGANVFLYHNVGRDITEHLGKLVMLILQWNPEWLKFQKSASYLTPPIFNSYPSITTSYVNQIAYFNTYVTFHLLHLWCSTFKYWCAIFEHWSNRKGIRCNILCVRKARSVFSIDCSTDISDGDWLPIVANDIALCSHQGEEAFIRVQSFKKKPTGIDRISKLKITLQSLHDLKLQPADTVDFFILFNFRTAYLEAKALKSLDNSMRDVILQPELNQQSVAVVGLAATKSQKEHRDDVLKAFLISHVRVIVVETCPSVDVNLLITHVAYNIACNQNNNNLSKVLIFLKHEALLEKLFKYLFNYKPVLFVCTKQMSLPDSLAEHTFESHLRRKRKFSDIVSTGIFITTFSAFGPQEQNYLYKSKLNRKTGLTCIVEAAHLCSEAETALPLTLNLKKLVLIGDRFENFEFSEILKHHYSNSFFSLFLRLLKAKRCL